MLIEGKYSIKNRLRSGDIVFVEARKNIVSIDGAVNRPAKYEVLDDQNLYSVINMLMVLREMQIVKIFHLKESWMEV